MQHLLFPFEMRTTTWLCVLAFAVLAIRRHDSRPLVACCVWLLGFEVAFDVSRYATGQAGPFMTWALPLIVGVFTIVWSIWNRLFPSLPWVAVTAVIWAIWLAAGFHVNQHTILGFDWTAELLNVSAKTAWAAAYFVPMLALSGPVAGFRRGESG